MVGSSKWLANDALSIADVFALAYVEQVQSYQQATMAA